MFVDPSRDNCSRLLEPFHDRFFAVPQYALTRFLEIPDDLRLPLEIRKRAFATTMWAFEMQAVESLFGSLPNVKLHEEYESILAEIANTIMVRFKKVNKQGLSASYPTQRAMSYDSAANQGELFDSPAGWSAPIRLDLGYLVANDTERLEIGTVRMIHRDGDRILWQYTIVPPADPDAMVSEILPAGPSAPRIVPKGGEQHTAQEEGE